MNGLEAMTRVLALSEQAIRDRGIDPQDPANMEDRDVIAMAVISALLNTAMPIVRFRAHVQIEDCETKKVPQGEFTVLGVNMTSIRAGLETLMQHPLKVHVSLWEQRATGADMISGYQGPTKAQNFRVWIRSIESLQAMPTVQ